MEPKLREDLSRTDLFSACDPEGIRRITDGLRYRIAQYERGTPVAVEGSPCRHLGVILEGAVDIQKILGSGRPITVDRLPEGSVFGEALLFPSHKRYVATITAAVPSTIMYISSEEIARLCREEPGFLERFLALMSEKMLMLNRRIRELSYATIRHKVAARLLEESMRQHSHVVDLGVSRREMAEDMAIPRPSLSRELARMRDAGLLSFCGSRVTILDPEGLEDILFS